MSTLNSKIRVSELDFESIKTNFKSFMSAQSEFADYDFEASGMSILMDLLAYNTYYNSVLANYTANETFIDSAVKRDSVVSHAKALGYTPKAVKSSRAKLKMTLRNVMGEPSQLVMPAGTPFEATIKEDVYQFVTIDTTVAPVSDNEFTFDSFYVYQGIFQQNTFYANGDVVEKFTLPNPNVDVTSIRVYVRKSESDLDMVAYGHVDTIIDLNPESIVFFTQEGISNLTEIYFGDGILGKQLAAGNVVHVTYITSAGQVTNGCKVFKLTGAVEGNTNATVTTLEIASGGSDAEEIESIRFNAMTYFGVQNRAVTAEDSRALVMQKFSNIKDIIVWGGEKQTPPEYGKIFICVQPKNTDFLTTSEKEEITTIVKQRAVANISPKFVDPEFIDIELYADVYYDRFRNDKSTVDLKNIVVSDINDYANKFLNRFDSILRYSLVSKIIDSSDYSILSNLLKIKVYKSFLPVLFYQNIISFKFYNNITSIGSTGFYVEGLAEKVYVRNNGSIAQLYYYTATKELKIYKDVGTVDLTNGTINLDPLLITKFDGSEIRLYATPYINDVFSKNNNITRLQSKNVFVNIYDDKIRS